MVELPLVNGFEVLPLRLIPFVTDPPLSTKTLLEHLYNRVGDYFPGLHARNVKQPLAAIDAGDWRNMYDLGNDDFPAGLYIRKKSFEAYCHRVKPAVGFELVTLRLTNQINGDKLKAAFEGFEPRAEPLAAASKLLASKRTVLRDGHVEHIMERISQERKQANPKDTMINHLRFMSDAGVPLDLKTSVNMELKKRITTNYNGCYCALSRPPKKNEVEPYFLPPNKVLTK